MTTAADEMICVRASLVQARWPRWHARDELAKAVTADEMRDAAERLAAARANEDALLDRLLELLAAGGGMRARHRAG